jgi:hypothetical protein
VCEVVDALTVVLLFVHAGIGLCMAWIGLTVQRANVAIVATWFAISILTVVALGHGLR